MTLLPIVERELRVASRRRATYWLRFFLALAVFALWFLLMTFGPSAVPINRGQMVFLSLATLAFTCCLLSGVLLTADSLSQEKREGTLGLLFLTELKGYDVVLGKLIATSIHAFYGLGATLPLLTYSMLIGGVTFGEFWRFALTLIATLFLSLSVGVLISSRTRDTREAMGRTAAAIAALAVIPGFGGILVSILKTQFWRVLEWPSPIYLFNLSFDSNFRLPGGPLQFIASLFTVLLLGAGMLAFAGRDLSRVWREKADSEETPLHTHSRWYSIFGPAFRAHAISGNPYYWLGSRDLRPTYKIRATLVCFFAIWIC